MWAVLSRLLGVWAQTGARAIANRCRKRGLLLNDGFMWFLTRTREPVRSHKSRTRCCCAYCGAPGEHETGSCTVTMQYGDEKESRMLYQAEYPPHGNCMSVIEALLMANNLHEEDVGSHTV